MNMRIEQVRLLLWTCPARGTVLDASALRYKDRDHGHAEADRMLSDYPLDEIDVDQLRCSCGSGNLRPVRREE